MATAESVIKNVLNDDCCNTLQATKASKTQLLAQIQSFQERIRTHIEANYINFMPNNTTSDAYLNDSETLVRAAEQLLNTTSQDAVTVLLEANEELEKLIQSLNEAYLGLRVSQRILQVDNMYKSLNDAISAKDLSVMIAIMEKLKLLIFNEDENDKISLDVEHTFQLCACYDTIKIKYAIQMNLLQQHLKQRFEQLLLYNEKPFPQAKCITIQVSKDENQLQEITMALFQLNYNATQLSHFLLEQCFEPIILKPVSLHMNDDMEFVEITLSYALKAVNNINLRPTYAQVFAHIKSIFDCLCTLNVCIDNEKHVFSIIGDYIKHKLLALIVDDCLMHNLPNTIEKYENSKMIEDVLNFEHYLADIFFISMDNKSDRLLTQFTQHFDDYFRNNFTGELIKAANKIMQKDLQDMTMIADKHAIEDVANKPLLFPRCMISKSTLELNKLLERIVRQANENAAAAGDNEVEDNYGLRSVITVILNSYALQMPNLHEKLLESIPQQSALFYNNCMYLAYWVALHADKHVDSLPALVKTLQSTGNKYLNVQIEYQQKIITNIIKELDVSDAHCIGSIPNKLIRQCLRQFELLHNVWQNVLPETVYNKTFCRLLHDFFEDIIKRIQSLEDISATVANELSELIDIILQKAPTLFKESHAVIQINSWQKLEQMKLMLNASLLEIVEQWCEGAGPLTANFTADEVRHLIRALFQNTDRRANALAKIC